MANETCKQFDGICECGKTEALLLNAGKFSERFFADILYAIVTRNMPVPGDVVDATRVHLSYDPTLKRWMDYRVRCDGIVYVGDGFDGSVVNYHVACLALVDCLTNSYKTSHPDSRYIRTLNKFLNRSMLCNDMDDTIALVEMYVKACE